MAKVGDKRTQNRARSRVGVCLVLLVLARLRSMYGFIEAHTPD